MSHEDPPLMLPLRNVVMVDPETGLCTVEWYRFFVDLCSRAGPLEQILPLEASPITLKTNHPGHFLIVGDATNVALSRGIKKEVTIDPLGVTTGFIPVEAGDKLVIEYAGLPEDGPDIWFVPEGVPA